MCSEVAGVGEVYVYIEHGVSLPILGNAGDMEAHMTEDIGFNYDDGEDADNEMEEDEDVEDGELEPEENNEEHEGEENADNDNIGEEADIEANGPPSENEADIVGEGVVDPRFAYLFANVEA
ncbi:unnamed protein product [Cochlearia groenlandica]